MMEYLSIKQVSEKWGLSTRRINVLCSEPAEAEKPKDARIKSGKYVVSASNIEC